MKKSTQDIINYLSTFITKRRLSLIHQVLENRTRYITVALEDIYQSHNTSAVLRTCECFGIQDIHIIENKNRYTVNPDVVLGATKWLNLYKYNKEAFNTLHAVKHLRSEGYRIIATTLKTDSTNLEDFDLAKGKVALFFGTELTGLTESMLENADEYLRIPMYGFTESFNISVSAAMMLYHLTHEMRELNLGWQLQLSEKENLTLQWIKKSINHPDQLIQRFLKNETDQ